MIFKGMLIFLGLFQLISCEKDPEQILAVQIKFDANIGYVSIIETIKNDTSVYLDTVIHEFLPSKTNGYKFQLEFKREESNGDYLIISHSCEKRVLISEVSVNEDYSFSYLFNGIKKTEKDLTIDVTYDMLCN